MRTVFIPEKKLIEIKKSVIADAVNDNGVSNNGACPENDEYMIGSEGGANDYFHVNESLMTESYNQFNLDEVGSLHYSVDNEYGYDEDTHKEWWNWYDSEEEYLRSCKNFDGEVYDTDGHQIGYFGGDADEIISMFGEDIGNENSQHTKLEPHHEDNTEDAYAKRGDEPHRDKGLVVAQAACHLCKHLIK